MKVGGLFTGIGAHAECLKGMPDVKIVFQSENDERTAKAYDMMHGTTHNLGDVTKIDGLDDYRVDLLYASPPCQDISPQGKRAGLGAGTRSGLIREVPRIIGETRTENRPTAIIWEDVPTLVNTKNRPIWDGIEREMAMLGYRTEWKILNAYDYGIPQSRKRFYAISRRDHYSIDFPRRQPLYSAVRDYLEEDVDARYYLSDKRFKGILSQSKEQKRIGNGFVFRPTDADGYAHAITTKEGCVKTSNYLVVEKGLKVLGSLDLKGWNESICRVYDPDQCSPTITGSYSTHVAKFQLDDTRVRRLTPRECFRLQAFSEESFDRISELPMSFLYRLAGNSICVAPLKAITMAVLHPTVTQSSIDSWSAEGVVS